MFTKKVTPILVLLCLFASLLGTQARAASLGTGQETSPSVSFEVTATGLDQPLFATHAGDGSGRIFIIERTGKIKILKGSALLATPFLDVHTLLAQDGGEQGLLGLAFAPDYAASGTFYISYTALDYSITLARYKISGDADVADPSSAQALISVPKIYANHNGGMLAFGKDGYLYLSTGDGGSGGDPDNNAQNRQSLLGKILRLDVSGSGTYTIPPTNPYYSDSGGLKKEIWAYGLRNAWRFSFDRSNGDLFIGDVGQEKFEEVHFQAAGAGGGQNYGWRILEGDACYNPATCAPPDNYVAPIAVYEHGVSDSNGCSITGGYVYRGAQFPALEGLYLYGDFCTGKLWGLEKDASNQWVSSLLADTAYLITSFGEDESGELYLTDYSSGQLLHITSSPIVTAQFTSAPALDGWILESGEKTNLGGMLNPTAKTLTLGDDAYNRQYRSILSFDTRGLPDNAVIVSATLKIKKVKTIGASPFTTLGKLVADVGKPLFGGNANLQNIDFQAQAGNARSATFSSAPANNWYSAALIQASLGKINLKGHTQFRLRFSRDDNNNFADNRINVASGNAANNRPVLVIEYYSP